MSRRRVLLLEDDLALRGLLLEVLSIEGFDVVGCESFDEIQHCAAGGGGQLIVADFWGAAQSTLNDDGRQQIRQLTQLLPVVLLTGRSWATETSAEELGARALIRKPFDLDDLLDTVNAVLPPP